VRVRVRFRFNAESGEVEVFQVDDLRDGPPLADHDARHDRAAFDVARVIENNPLIEEVSPAPYVETTAPPSSHTSQASPPDRGAVRSERLHE
jgi:hypothetical protein